MFRPLITRTASLFSHLSSYGIPLNKIVVGKYNLAGVDASNGFVSAPALGAWFATAQTQLGWRAGVMCWAYQASTSAAWIAAAWPFAASATAAAGTKGLDESENGNTVWRTLRQHSNASI